MIQQILLPFRSSLFPLSMRFGDKIAPRNWDSLLVGQLLFTRERESPSIPRCIVMINWTLFLMFSEIQGTCALIFLFYIPTNPKSLSTLVILKQVSVANLCSDRKIQVEEKQRKQKRLRKKRRTNSSKQSLSNNLDKFFCPFSFIFFIIYLFFKKKSFCHVPMWEFQNMNLSFSYHKFENNMPSIRRQRRNIRDMKLGCCNDLISLLFTIHAANCWITRQISFCLHVFFPVKPPLEYMKDYLWENDSIYE